MRIHAQCLRPPHGKMIGIIAILLLSGCASATAPATSVPNVTAAFVLEEGNETRVLTYEDSTEMLRLFQVQDGLFVEQTSFSSPATPHKAIMLSGNIIVGYGYGRGKLSDPINIVRYDANLENPTTLFTRAGERSEINQLLAVDGQLFFAFFTSKYDTTAGWLRADGTFDALIQARLGMQYDVSGDAIVQGRPYGDAAGEDGDVTLITGGNSERLPSFRGVQSVRFGQADNDPEQELFIGDGWHQNYGQIAEPRISILDKQGDAYELETLATLAPQHSISQINPFEAGGKRYLFVSGNARADIIDLANKSVQNIIQSDDIYFKALLLDVRGTTVRALVLGQNGMRIISGDVE